MTETDLLNRYARLFDLTGDVTSSAMQFGLQVERIWLPVIERMCAELALVAPEDFAITGVKEKFGTLRVWYRGGSPKVERIVDAARSGINSMSFD